MIDIYISIDIYTPFIVSNSFYLEELGITFTRFFALVDGRIFLFEELFCLKGVCTCCGAWDNETKICSVKKKVTSGIEQIIWGNLILIYQKVSSEKNAGGDEKEADLTRSLFLSYLLSWWLRC